MQPIRCTELPGTAWSSGGIESATGVTSRGIRCRSRIEVFAAGGPRCIVNTVLLVLLLLLLGHQRGWGVLGREMLLGFEVASKQLVSKALQ